MYSALYTLAFCLATPFQWLSPRRRAKRLAVFRARMGLAPYPVDARRRPAIWIHAVSVGEALAAKSLVKALRQAHPEHAVMVSTTTLDGAKVARENLDADGYFFFPYDWAFSVRRAVRAIRAEVCILMESELWPNFIKTLKRERVGLILANGRISDRSFPRYRRFRWFFRPLLRDFDAICAQSELDAGRLAAIGAHREDVIATGNLKRCKDQFEIDPHKLDVLRCMVGHDPERPWFVAGSTHAGEESAVLRAFQRARRVCPGLRLILAPRRPRRFDEVAQLLWAEKIPFQRFSELEDRSAAADVVLLDALGWLMPAYRLARVAFIGGSLIPKGGHNLMEACAAGAPVLFGPRMHNFRAIRDDALACGAGAQVEDGDALAEALIGLLTVPARHAACVAGAEAVMRRSQHALPCTLAVVERTLTGHGRVRPAAKNKPLAVSVPAPN